MPSSRYLYSRNTTIDRSWHPSQIDGDFLNDTHRNIVDIVANVSGKLQRPDHFKLYEMAYLAQGPILEIGRDQGKSLSILAMAVETVGLTCRSTRSRSTLVSYRSRDGTYTTSGLIAACTCFRETPPP